LPAVLRRSTQPDEPEGTPPAHFRPRGQVMRHSRNRLAATGSGSNVWTIQRHIPTVEDIHPVNLIGKWHAVERRQSSPHPAAERRRLLPHQRRYPPAEVHVASPDAEDGSTITVSTTRYGRARHVHPFTVPELATGTWCISSGDEQRPGPLGDRHSSHRYRWRLCRLEEIPVIRASTTAITSSVELTHPRS
jgi:hypothetical protein